MEFSKLAPLRAGFPPAALQTAGGYVVSVPGGVDEVVIQLNNVEVLRIQLGANMTIRSLGDLLLEAPNITLKADNSLTVQSGNNLKLRSDSSVGVQSMGNLSMQAFGTMDVSSSATMSVQGAFVNINNGALEIV